MDGALRDSLNGKTKEPLTKGLFTLRYLSRNSTHIVGTVPCLTPCHAKAGYTSLRANGLLQLQHVEFPFVVRYRTTNGSSFAGDSKGRDKEGDANERTTVDTIGGMYQKSEHDPVHEVRQRAARHVHFPAISDLYDWSVDNIPDFWAAVWDFLEIKASKKYDKVVEDLNVFPGARWFPGRAAQLCREPSAVPGRPDGHRLQSGNKAGRSHHLRRSCREWSPASRTP